MPFTFPESTTPIEIGHEIASQFENGAAYVHVEGLPFVSMEDGQRDAYVTELSSSIGRLTLTGGEPGTELWRLNSATSPNASFIPYHTDNPFLNNPEQIVSFWNLHSSERGGENLILPVESFLDWLDSKVKKHDLAQELIQATVPFTLGDKSASGTIFDPEAGTVRYDQKYISAEYADLGMRLTKELNAASFMAHSVKLSEGGVLFFNNQTTLHARSPYSDPNRLSLRVRVVPQAQ